MGAWKGKLVRGDTTPPLHHSPTPPLHYSTIPPFHHSSTPPLPHSTTPLLPTRQTSLRLLFLVSLTTSLHSQDQQPVPTFPRRNAIVIAVERTAASVVNISTERIVVQRTDPFFKLRGRFSDPFFDNFFSRFGQRRQVRTNSLGSGVILDPSGYIVTNEHVIRKASEIHVTLQDKTTVKATLVSSDPENDLAVLKVPAGDKLHAAPIGTSTDLMIGETAIAAGNPFGLENSVSVGVISAKNRSIVADGEVVFDDFLQTDAAINPGNSGGPLLNIHGEVIGINTAVYAEGQGIGFAIPIDKVINTLEGLLDFRVLKEIWFGAKVQRLTKDLASGLGLKAAGILVSDIEPKSPAETAGLKPSDIITRIDNHRINNLLDFKKEILRHEKSDRLSIHYLRDGRIRISSLTLGAIPPLSSVELIRKKLGVKLLSVTTELAKRYRLRVAKGLVVTEIEIGGPAHQAGLRQLDVLIQIGRLRLNKAEHLARLLKEVKPKSKVAVLLLRGDYLARALVTTR
jgi:serine protease Do